MQPTPDETRCQLTPVELAISRKFGIQPQDIATLRIERERPGMTDREANAGREHGVWLPTFKHALALARHSKARPPGPEARIECALQIAALLQK